MSDYSTFLFANPSFAEGAARILDFGNTLFMYNGSESGAEADESAMLLDFAAVGRDLHHSFETVKERGCGAQIKP